MHSQPEICKARTLFVTRGILNREIISSEIVYSWVRSKLHNISFEILTQEPQIKKYNLLSLDKYTTQVMHQLRNYKHEDGAIFLVHSDGSIIYRSEDRSGKIPIFSDLREEMIGTTAAGISLLTGENVKVSGCEHYNSRLTHFITESLVLAGSNDAQERIIMVLTPLSQSIAHNRLINALKTQFQKEKQEILEVEDKGTDSAEIETTNAVNPINNPIKIEKNNRGEIKEETCDSSGCKRFTLSVIEEDTIREALNYYRWNLKRSAEALGIGRSTLYRKIKQYDIKE